MSKRIKIVSNSTDPSLRRQDYIDVNTMSKGFDNSWQAGIDEDYAMLVSDMDSADLSAVLSSFGLPENTSKETLVGLARLYCTTSGLSPEDVTYGSDQIEDNDVKERKNALINDFRTAMSNEAERSTMLSELLQGLKEIHITTPDIRNINAKDLERETRMARLNNQFMGLADIGDALGTPIFDGNTEFINDCKTIASNSAVLYNSLIEFLGKDRFGDDLDENNIDVSPRDLTQSTRLGLSGLVFTEIAPQDVTLQPDDMQAVTDIKNKTAVPTEFDQRVYGLFSGDKGIQRYVDPFEPVAGNDNEYDFRNFSDDKLLAYVLDIDEDDLKKDLAENKNNVLSNIYIDGRSLKDMELNEAAAMIKESLYLDSPSILEIKDPDSGILTPFFADVLISHSGFQVLREAERYKDEKIKRVNQYEEFTNDVIKDPSAENLAQKGIIQAPAADLSSAQYISAIVGKDIDTDNPESIRDAVQNVYIDGKNIVDTLKLDMTSDNLDAYAQAIKDALDTTKNENHFVTLMNRSSIFAEPKAVLPAGDLKAPSMADKIRPSLDFMLNYHEAMSVSARSAREKAEALRKRNEELFLAQKDNSIDSNSFFNNMASRDFGKDRSLMPALYMMTKGYSMDDAFGNNPALDETKKQIGKEFFDLITLRKNERGEYINSISDPKNFEYYKKTIEPVLTDMMAVLGGIKTEYLDINVKENLDKVAFMNRIYGVYDIIRGMESVTTGVHMSVMDGVAYPCSTFYDISHRQLYALENKRFSVDDAFEESMYRLSGDPSAIFGGNLSAYPSFETARSMSNRRAGAREQINDAITSNLTAVDLRGPVNARQMQLDEYKNGNVNAFIKNIRDIDGEKLMNLYRNAAANSAKAPAQDSKEYKEYTKRQVLDNCLGVENLHPRKYEEAKADTGTKFISEIVSMNIDEYSPVEVIDSALSKIYINDRSLKDYLSINPEECVNNMDKLKYVNNMLKGIAVNAFEGKSNIAILRKEMDGAFTPIIPGYLQDLSKEDMEDYENFKEKDPQEIEKMNKAEKSRYARDLRNYEYTKNILEKDAKNAAGRPLAEAYAKMLNNETLKLDERELLHDKKLLIKGVVSTRDIMDTNGASFFEKLTNEVLSNEDKLKSVVDDFYINDKSFYEYFGLDRNTATAAQIRQKEAELAQIVKDEFKYDAITTGNDAKFLFMKDKSGTFRPITFYEPVPEIKPEVKPLTFWERFKASPEEKAQNQRAIEEHNKSIEEHVRAQNRNINAEERNKAATAYARALNKQTLSESDKKILSDRDINLPNIDFYGRGNLPSANVRSINLDHAQQLSGRSNSNTQNRSLTGFTNDNTPNTPEMRNSGM